MKSLIYLLPVLGLASAWPHEQHEQHEEHHEQQGNVKCVNGHENGCVKTTIGTTVKTTTTVPCETPTSTPTQTPDHDPSCLHTTCPPGQHAQWNQKSYSCVCVMNPTTYPVSTPSPTGPCWPVTCSCPQPSCTGLGVVTLVNTVTITTVVEKTVVVTEPCSTGPTTPPGPCSTYPCTLSPSPTPSPCSTYPCTLSPSPTPSPSTTTSDRRTDCEVGTPATVDGGAAGLLTIYGQRAFPTPAIIGDYVPHDMWAKKLGIGSTSIYNAPAPTAGKAYAEYKCSQACNQYNPGNGSTPGCQSWFLGYDKSMNYWSCSQYIKLMDAYVGGNILIPISQSGSNLTNGSAWNAICDSASACTTGVPVVLNPSQTITYAKVTPTEPLPATGTLQGYTVETGFKDKYTLSEHDVVMGMGEGDRALMECQQYCGKISACASWFVGFFLKGAGGYFWRCTQFSELLTPAQFVVKPSFSNMVNSTGWNEICKA